MNQIQSEHERSESKSHLRVHPIALEEAELPSGFSQSLTTGLMTFRCGIQETVIGASGSPLWLHKPKFIWFGR